MEKKEKHKVLIRKDGIVYIEIGEIVSEEGIRDLIDRLIEILKKVPKRTKILLNIGAVSLVRSSSFRKELADRIKYIFENYEFEKGAFYGPSAKTRTVTSFIIATTGLNNMKVFKSEEEALKWLKEA